MRQASTPAAHPIYLTVPQVCETLQVASSTLYQWWRGGKGPRKAILPNGSFRVHPDWLDDFMLKLEAP